MSTQQSSKSLIAQAGNQLDGFRETVAKIREHRANLEKQSPYQRPTMMLQSKDSDRRSKWFKSLTIFQSLSAKLVAGNDALCSSGFMASFIVRLNPFVVVVPGCITLSTSKPLIWWIVTPCEVCVCHRQRKLNPSFRFPLRPCFRFRCVRLSTSPARSMISLNRDDSNPDVFPKSSG
jgi:hypothetical protein